MALSQTNGPRYLTLRSLDDNWRVFIDDLWLLLKSFIFDTKIEFSKLGSLSLHDYTNTAEFQI